jgi:hypothetical protein
MQQQREIKKLMLTFIGKLEGKRTVLIPLYKWISGEQGRWRRHKGKQSHNTHVEAKGGEEISSYSFMILALDGVSGHHNAHTVFNPWGKESRNPLNRRLGGSQSRSGHRG